MRKLRAGPRRSSIPYRGAEDREEGSQGAEPEREEEMIGVETGRFAHLIFRKNGSRNTTVIG